MRSLFRSWGFESEIYCQPQSILPQLRNDARGIDTWHEAPHDDDIVILHLSMGSEVNLIFKDLSCKKVILYHNVTPPHYYDAIARQTAVQLRKGQQHVDMLAGVADVNLADSQYNASELEAAGYTNVNVLPLILDLNTHEAVDKKILRKFDDDAVNILFVGRCAPNKKIEDALLAFNVFQKCVEPKSRFISAGSFNGTERYYYLLETMKKDLALENVHFPGSVPQEHLNALFRTADLFLCMSEHEGFCIPLIEAMQHDIPILAYNACAVPETLDGAGVLFDNKQFDQVAEMMGQLVKNKPLRESVIQGQRSRMNRFRDRDAEAELKAALAPVLTATATHTK